MTVAASGAEITFQKEFFYRCMRELPPLFMAEWDETIQDNPAQQELDPAWEKYISMEIAGILQMFTARVNGKLIGYIISVLHPHLHFFSTPYAFIDAFYIAPEYRAAHAEDFILKNHILLHEQGVKCIHFAVPASLWQRHLLKKLQYARIASIFAKWL